MAQEIVPFQGVIGQERVRLLLMRTITTDRMAHAYLFIGPAGSGRRALAIELARTLNCPNGPEDAALKDCACHSCKAMQSWRHPNLIPVFPLPRSDLDKGEAADKALAEILTTLAADPYAPLSLSSKTGNILLRSVQDARNLLSLAPDRPGTRVVIIHPADRLKEEAANALLKLLEEPPEQCLFVLTAESRRELLPTILSRCQHIRFTPLSASQIESALMSRQGMDSDRAAVIASLAGGDYTRALTLAADRAEEQTREGIEFLRAAVTGNAPKLAGIMEGWTGEGSRRMQIIERLDFTALWLLDALCAAADGGKGMTAMRIARGDASVLRMGERYGAAKLQDALAEVEEAKLAIEASAMPPLVLAALAFKLHRTLH